MGVYLHYQAMPEGSRLARRLRTERLLCVLYAELIHMPAGPYDTARLQPQEREEYLTEIAGNPLFGSREAVDRVYADLQAELARAANEFPGLPQRAAYFKLQDFDHQLAQALAATGRPDAEALAETLVWGARPFAPEGFGTSNVQLRVVPPSLVVEAAGLLQGVDLDSFDGWEEEWEAFRGVYVEAAARGEAIVIASGSRVEPSAAPDQAGISVFWSILSLRPAWLVSYVVRYHVASEVSEMVQVSVR